jgi:hypothetical protein
MHGGSWYRPHGLQKFHFCSWHLFKLIQCLFCASVTDNLRISTPLDNYLNRKFSLAGVDPGLVQEYRWEFYSTDRGTENVVCGGMNLPVCLCLLDMAYG